MSPPPQPLYALLLGHDIISLLAYLPAVAQVDDALDVALAASGFQKQHQQALEQYINEQEEDEVEDSDDDGEDDEDEQSQEEQEEEKHDNGEQGADSNKHIRSHVLGCRKRSESSWTSFQGQKRLLCGHTTESLRRNVVCGTGMQPAGRPVF